MRRELHARGQAEGIHIEDRVVRVHELRHGVVALGRGPRHRHLALLAERLVRAERLLLLLLLLGVRERFGIGAGPGLGGVLVFDHVGLRVVLLFCTHGINLGPRVRSKKNKGVGQLAELLNVIPEVLKGGRVVRSRYGSASCTTRPAASLSFLSQGRPNRCGIA